MSSLNDKDHELISQAQNAIRLNYDAVGERHTVGAAVRLRTKNCRAFCPLFQFVRV